MKLGTENSIFSSQKLQYSHQQWHQQPQSEQGKYQANPAWTKSNPQQINPNETQNQISNPTNRTKGDRRKWELQTEFATRYRDGIRREVVFNVGSIQIQFRAWCRAKLPTFAHDYDWILSPGLLIEMGFFCKSLWIRKVGRSIKHGCRWGCILLCFVLEYWFCQKCGGKMFLVFFTLLPVICHTCALVKAATVIADLSWLYNSA